MAAHSSLPTVEIWLAGRRNPLLPGIGNMRIVRMVIIIGDDMDTFENAESIICIWPGNITCVNGLAVSGIKVSGIKV